jgi:SAM-dependent methyltransferase
MSDFLHIDQDVHILTGEAARQALARNNDSNYLSPDKGIVQVPEARWRVAQRAERTHWMKLGLGSDDDRNIEHSQGFDNYHALAGRVFESAIELGCGPFTNLSIIGEHCTIRECSLLDPLIEDYLSHPYCSYNRERLLLGRYLPPTPAQRIWNAVRRKLPGGVRRRLPVWRTRQAKGPPIAIRELIAAPIEQMKVSSKYHLVVVINVIEHCYDIERVFANILDMLAPGGILVFHDKLYDHDAVRAELQTTYDAAHPLRVDRRVITQFLDQHFASLQTRVLSANWSVQDRELQSDMVYFIGQRKE